MSNYEKYGLNRSNVELIHVDWRNTVSKQPYFVALDKDKNRLIISIRGTMSKYDVLTDVKGEVSGSQKVTTCEISLEKSRHFKYMTPLKSC